MSAEMHATTSKNPLHLKQSFIVLDITMINRFHAPTSRTPVSLPIGDLKEKHCLQKMRVRTEMHADYLP